MNNPDESMQVEQNRINETDANAFDLINFEIEELENRLTLRHPEDGTEGGCATGSCSWPVGDPNPQPEN
jgi:hypothetical protein